MLRHQSTVLRRQRPGRPASSRRSNALGFPVSALAKLLESDGPGEADYRRPMAPPGLPTVLAVAIPAPRPRTPGGSSRDSRSDTRNEPGQSVLGCPRVHGELLKLGISSGQTAVSKYMARRAGSPSPSWRTFLGNQMHGIAAVDVFVVATAAFRLRYVMVVLHLARRKIAHFDLTKQPSQDWLSRQVTEAFPWDTAQRYLLRDRDSSYEPRFHGRVRAMGMEEVITAPRSAWQTPYVERLIGSIRRECLDHIVIFNERHMRRVLTSYFDYYHRTRTHLSFATDCPDRRPVQSADSGKIIAFPEVGGLHHRYERLAAWRFTAPLRDRPLEAHGEDSLRLHHDSIDLKRQLTPGLAAPNACDPRQWPHWVAIDIHVPLAFTTHRRG